MKTIEINPVLIKFDGMSDTDLLSVRVLVEKEFKRRGLKFNKGDIGEAVAIDFFNRTPGLTKLQLAPTGTKNVDAISRDGERYSIKTIKDGSKTGTIYPDADDKNKQLFEHLLLVQLNENYELKSVNQFSWKQFLKVRCWDKRMNAWYIPKSLKALKESNSIL
jgi:hypothetical protein